MDNEQLAGYGYIPWEEQAGHSFIPWDKTSIKDWQTHVWQISENHGFHSDGAGISDKLMLIVDELSEAHEELRDGHGLTEVYYNSDKPDKPEGFPVELADALIRLLDLAEICGFDMQAMVELKSRYNETRPFMHGKLF